MSAGRRGGGSGELQPVQHDHLATDECPGDVHMLGQVEKQVPSVTGGAGELGKLDRRLIQAREPAVACSTRPAALTVLAAYQRRLGRSSADQRAGSGSYTVTLLSSWRVPSTTTSMCSGRCPPPRAAAAGRCARCVASGCAVATGGAAWKRRPRRPRARGWPYAGRHRSRPNLSHLSLLSRTLGFPRRVETSP